MIYESMKIAIENYRGIEDISLIVVKSIFLSGFIED
jgi:hypothetical protein